ncbi:unnamed protein product [Vitrella brassicaformis CCMP3155]|uniref:RxLR effector protein n=1 Tax=Vitrella brassicaformis (strain CCMP3155) TaxID=1169540 RepID=A0A0G4EPP5_VITBC|nr:unnamed protein product [Vitrella brassicaformis CCMP3155]|eukprot:CEL99438.1 unnamed protein product [Vitrella brassicaformis CCMP3155]
MALLRQILGFALAAVVLAAFLAAQTDANMIKDKPNVAYMSFLARDITKKAVGPSSVNKSSSIPHPSSPESTTQGQSTRSHAKTVAVEADGRRRVIHPIETQC